MLNFDLGTLIPKSLIGMWLKVFLHSYFAKLVKFVLDFMRKFRVQTYKIKKKYVTFFRFMVWFLYNLEDKNRSLDEFPKKKN